jgi:Flp pilus assembly protein TadD
MGRGSLAIGAITNNTLRTVIFMLVFGTTFVQAEESCTQPIANLTSLQGQVDVRTNVTGTWHPAAQDDPLCGGNEIRTGAFSRAQIRLHQNAPGTAGDGTLMQLKGLSSLVLPKTEKPSLIDLLRGQIHILTRTPKSLTIKTLFCNANVEGTEFLVQADPDNTKVSVYEGQVKVSNDLGSTQLIAGEAAIAVLNKAPRREILIKPRDAVQWALYYPPIIDPQIVPPGSYRSTYSRVLDLYKQNQIADAIGVLDKIPDAQREPYYHELRAALNLSVGQVEYARKDITTAITLNANDANAYALESIIALVQNHKEKAQDYAKRAIDADNKSPTAWVADSYAKQADFKLDAALRSANQAVTFGPDNALAWARVSELELAHGNLRKSDRAGDRARSLDPTLARTQTISGFAALTRIDIPKAKAAFTEAIQRDPADPLPRLGLGLAKIRKGLLAEGRKDIEDAANIDPDNSLVRSYLGKAYYEEKRNDLAAKEFYNAKTLDPKDPTSWFYDGIRKQTENQPIEALHDLQTTIDLNDNRAIYRSRLDLDQDRALRGTTLARTFDNLGFKRRAVIESTKSLSVDPTDYSAHRFLSDTYAGLTRYAIAQVSELLQAQLLQPINVQPVQPRLSVTGTELNNTRVGPAQAAFNEFTSLFERNRPRFLLSGLAGTNDTFGDEAVLSGIQDRVSYSFGQSHYQSNGFRTNDDAEHNNYDAFVQAQLSQNLNIQFEYRRRESRQGDPRLSINSKFKPTDRRTLDQDIGRAGLHLAITPRQHLLASFIYSARTEDLDKPADNDIRRIMDHRNAYNAEAQYLLTNELVDIVLGGGAYHIDANVSATEYLSSNICPQDRFVARCEDPNQARYLPDPSIVRQHNVYLYSNWKLPQRLTGTLGVSYDSYDEQPLSNGPYAIDKTYRQRINPKLGLQWELYNNFRVRGVYVHTLKRQLVVDQTIEPTQVAGFNQFYDDFNGTFAKMYGVGADIKVTTSLYAGAEFTRRELMWLPTPIAEKGNEKQYRVYIHWAPLTNWSFNTEYQREEINQNLSGNQLLTSLQTTTVPVAVRYFSPMGIFAEFGTNFIWQRRADTNLITEKTTPFASTAFSLVNTALGYRLPKRRGILSLEVRNLLDKDFRLQDLSFKTSDQFEVSHTILPGRTFLAHFTMSFD